MKILSVKIEEFGCLSDKSFELAPGLNLITGDNESGKSTLLSFIKFIFYGLPRKTAESTPERDRMIGWRGNIASGSLTFSDEGGNIYTVERRAIRRATEKRESVSEECRIIDERSGTQIGKGESPAELFLGVPVSVFESTCFVRQLGLSDIETGEVGSSLENMLFSADESLNLQKSLDKLDSSRRLLLHKSGKGGVLADLEQEGDNLSARLEKAKFSYANILSKTESADILRTTALEKRKELDFLDDLFASVTKVATVKRFDYLHEKEKELSDLEAALEDFRARASSESGFLPDKKHELALSEALSSCIAADSEFNAAETNAKESRARRDSLQDIIAKSKTLSGLEIRARGGADAICKKLNADIMTADKKRSDGKGFMFGAAACLVLIAAAIAMIFFPMLGVEIIVSLASVFALVGACLLGFGLSLNKKSKDIMQSVEELLAANGAPPYKNTSLADRITLAKDNMLSRLDQESELARLNSETTAAGSVLDLRKKDLDAARAKAKALLDKWQPEDGSIEGDLIKVIRYTAEQAKMVADEYEFRAKGVTEAKSRVAAAGEGLADVNEAELRSRISPAAIEAFENNDIDELGRKRKFCSESLRAMNDQLREAEKDLVRLENETENPARLAASLEENRRKYAEEKLRFDAIVKAYEALSNAGGNIRSSITPVLRARAEKYMSALTGGKYTSLGIDNEYAMTALSEASGTRSVELLSRGTKDAAYLSLRLALLSVIFRDKTPFLAMDETLSQLDDKRAAAALRIVDSYCKTGGQCLLFTCHTREETLLKDISDTAVVRLSETAKQEIEQSAEQGA